MGSLSIWHLMIVALLAVLLFGRGKISDLMGDVAKGIKSFKKGMTEEEPRPAGPGGMIAAPGSVIDALVLSTVVTSGGSQVAHLKTTSGEILPGLKEGDEFRGWRVKRIDADAVVFAADGVEKRIESNKVKA